MKKILQCKILWLMLLFGNVNFGGLNSLLAVEFVPYLGSLNYSYKTSRSTPIIGLDFFAKIYKDLSAGFGVGYFSTELGSVSQQLSDLGIILEDKTINNISSFPVSFNLKYQHNFNDNWSGVIITKAGIAGGSNTYYIATDNSYQATAVTSGIYGLDVGFAYKNLLLTLAYNNLKIDNNYEDAKQGIYYTYHNRINYWGVRAGYFFK